MRKLSSILILLIGVNILLISNAKAITIQLVKKYKNFVHAISIRITNLNIKNIPILKKELSNRGIRTYNQIFPVRGILKEKNISRPTSKEYLNLMKSLDKNVNIIR